jgi:hypothetical protein
MNKRIESLEAVDAKMRPIKKELQEMQAIRDLIDADLRDDAKSLDRWGYEYDWQTKTASMRSSSESSASSSSETAKK